MPKREPTPPLEDEVKYLVVHYPYPLHADMKIAEEREAFAKWIACCIGQDYLFAIYHKPSAPNKVIIEIAKGCPNVNGLLGSHKWNEFLKKPEEDQIDVESKVFYCLHSRGREVQKHGWKRIDVHDNWFRNWSPETSEFVSNPYPTTRYCELPPETQTGARLCRPLPQEAFPKPKVLNPPVPGSSVWTKSKNNGVPIGPQLKLASSSCKKSESVGSTSVSVRWPSNSSNASSEDSRVNSPVISRASSTIPPPPGLLPPPGLAKTTSEKSESVQSDPEPPKLSEFPMPVSDSLEEMGLPMASAIVDFQETGKIDFGKLAITDVKETKDIADPEAPENYWAQHTGYKVDWDKAICPVHKQACKPGICKDMAILERQKKKAKEAKEREEAKRQAANQRQIGNANGDEWNIVGTNRGGRGGRGGGRGRGEASAWSSRGAPPGRGGLGRGLASDRGRSHDVPERNAWGVTSERGDWGGSFTGARDTFPERGGRETFNGGGRGGSPWAGTATMASHLKQTNSVSNGGRGAWFTRGGAEERGRGRGRGRGQAQPRAQAPIAESAPADGNEWGEGANEWTPWDNPGQKKTKKTGASCERSTSGGEESSRIGKGRKDSSSWAERTEKKEEVSQLPAEDAEGWPKAVGSSPWDADWPPMSEDKAVGEACEVGDINEQEQEPDPWAGRLGGPW